MDDRPMTDEERREMDHACEVVRRYMEQRPVTYDAPGPQTVTITPPRDLPRIDVEIGFAQPPAGADREQG